MSWPFLGREMNANAEKHDVKIVDALRSFPRVEISMISTSGQPKRHRSPEFCHGNSELALDSGARESDVVAFMQAAKEKRHHPEAAKSPRKQEQVRFSPHQ